MTFRKTGKTGRTALMGCLAAGAVAVAGPASATLIDFEDQVNPFSGGTVVTDQANSGDYSLYLAPGQQSVMNIPAEYLGKGWTITVTMQVYDQGMWIDPEVEGSPFPSRNNVRWGVASQTGTGSLDAEHHEGVMFVDANNLASGEVYGWSNSANARWSQWFSVGHFGGPRQVVELGDGGSYDEELEQWIAPQPGVGQWTEWTFEVANDGSTTITGDGVGTRTATISGGMQQIYLGGGTGSSPLGGIWVDDITIVPEPGTIGLLAMGGVMLLARRRR
ncbi:MAG: PEP-CTERM sorting domain-containing protein [Phycisphaeraceae bacterium]